MFVAAKLSAMRVKLRTRRLKASGGWASHALNKEIPETNWDGVAKRLAAAAPGLGLRIDSLPVDFEQYAAFKSEFAPGRFYAVGYKDKKILEHFIAHQLLDLRSGQVYIDVASENSPYPAQFRKRLGVEAYSQDLSYPPGKHGYTIGSGADSIPVPPASVDAISLQCAFEHFANAVDIRFIREAARILKPGGRCIVVPLYIGGTHLNIVDPVLDHSWIQFDENALPVGELDLGGTFERIYSPESLHRIVIPHIGLHYTLYRVHIPHSLLEAADNVEAVLRIRYVLEIRKCDTYCEKDGTAMPLRP